VQIIEECAGDYFNLFKIHQNRFGLAREGRQMFGMLALRMTDDSEIDLSVAYRNALDKSLPVGVALGGEVTNCANLMLRGNILVMRKHTKLIFDDIRRLIHQAFEECEHNYPKMLGDAEFMKSVKITTTRAHEYLGHLYGQRILSVTQFKIANEVYEAKTCYDCKAADKPQLGDVWTLYNASTVALKTCQASFIMERHVRLHETMLRFAGRS
jgi:hypothetical protein